jgi:uncharacterized membrane protein
MPTNPLPEETPAQAPEHVLQNIETIVGMHTRAERDVTSHQRAMDSVTAFVGQPHFVYLIVISVLGWIVLNLFSPHPFDPPPFTGLQGIVSLGALLMTTTIITTQNRLARFAEHRAHLDLQVNLSAEQKVGKVIALLEELRRDLPGVKDRIDPIANAMQEAVDPQSVASAITDSSLPAKDK